jgi:hypothetical protein
MKRDGSDERLECFCLVCTLIQNVDLSLCYFIRQEKAENPRIMRLRFIAIRHSKFHFK